MLHNIIEFIRNLIENIKRARGAVKAKGKGKSGAKRNPWPRCPQCQQRVPSLCSSAEPGAEPCGNGVRCGCCDGPHRGAGKSDQPSESDKIVHPMGQWT